MDLLDAAKCGVCLDLYSDPRFLSCGHTCCQKCLDPTLHAIQGKVGMFFQCPECREVTRQTKAGLQKNYAIRSMVDKIENSSGTQGVDKCNGCQNTVPLTELFRCTTCVQHSASTVDAEIRVCSMCIVMSHSRHDYQKLDVALKARGPGPVKPSKPTGQSGSEEGPGGSSETEGPDGHDGAGHDGECNGSNNNNNNNNNNGNSNNNNNNNNNCKGGNNNNNNNNNRLKRQVLARLDDINVKVDAVDNSRHGAAGAGERGGSIGDHEEPESEDADRLVRRG